MTFKYMRFYILTCEDPGIANPGQQEARHDVQSEFRRTRKEEGSLELARVNQKALAASAKGEEVLKSDNSGVAKAPRRTLSPVTPERLLRNPPTDPIQKQNDDESKGAVDAPQSTASASIGSAQLRYRERLKSTTCSVGATQVVDRRAPSPSRPGDINHDPPWGPPVSSRPPVAVRAAWVETPRSVFECNRMD